MLVELQDCIASIDKDGYNIITEEYRGKIKKTIKEIKDFEEKIFLAIDNNKVVCLINNQEESTYEFVLNKFLHPFFYT